VAAAEGAEDGGAGGDAPQEPLYARVARRVHDWGPGGTVGLVVGATAPSELREIRAVAPGLAFLVPGVGAQGGEIGPVLEAGPATADPAGTGRGAGLLVNISRGIAAAAADASDPGEAMAANAREWAARLPVLP
jgi:orotidine-5'-phosphate decarboxylase